MAPGERPTGLQDVTVTFGDDRPALRGVTLLAAPGEVLAIVGPSGSGKTTALRAVAGLQTVQRGRVLVAGRDVTATPTTERDIAMVFRSTTLVPFLDVAANLTRSAGADGVPEAARRVSARSVRRTVVDAVRRAGVGALYVTHDQTEAMAVGDRLAVLRDGEVLQVDRPREVYERPADVFVAEFVGGLGLLPARLVSAPGGAGFRVGTRTLPLWGPVPAELASLVDAPVLLGLRAEDVREAGPGADPGSVALPVAVRRVERPGGDALVRAEVGVAGEADGARLLARLPGSTRLRAGERAELLLDARRAHVFDPVTGRALSHPLS